MRRYRVMRNGLPWNFVERQFQLPRDPPANEADLSTEDSKKSVEVFIRQEADSLEVV